MKKGLAPVFGLILGMFLAGCQSPTLPDPNDPKNAGVMAPEVLRRNLAGAADAFFDRARHREITDAEARKMLTDYATELLKDIRPNEVQASQAWEYAEVLIAANRFADAEKMLMVALKNPQTEDRRVNDSLRLARCQAMLGDVNAAIATARTTFTAAPQEKAPILLAILMEVVPAGRGKGADAALADLLSEAIEQGRQVSVDSSTESGKSYFLALSYHIRRAEKVISELRAGGNST